MSKNYLRFASIFAVLAVLLAFSNTSAYEPYSGIRWDQDPALRFELSHEWSVFNNRMLQLDTKVRDAQKSPTRKLGMQTQYRFFEDPQWGKFEAYIDLALLTGTDAPDRIDWGGELGYTPAFLKMVRLELGTRRMHNIGEKNPDWGAKTHWIGACAKLLGSPDFLIDGCGRYHIISDMPATNITTTEHKNPMTMEVGLRSYYRPTEYIELALAPSAYLDRSLEMRRIGISPAATYYLGKHLHFPKGLNGLALRLSGNYSFLLNLDPSGKLNENHGNKREMEIGAGIIWEFK